MNAISGFLIRLVGYALALGIVSRVAEYLWIGRGLDGSVALQPFHDAGISTLVIAPIALAFGAGRAAALAVFLAAFLVGAALTAPFACARFAGG